MNTKLILIEGLPGFGKSTTARMVRDLLIENGIKTRLFSEGDLNHPADYDGVACIPIVEFEACFQGESYYSLFLEHSVRRGEDMLLPYRKLCEERSIHLSNDTYQRILKYDIYELPLSNNIELITERWRQFGNSASNEQDVVYIFECCFIQNPVTVGMVKYNAQDQIVLNYVLQLEQAVRHLDPLLIYIEQDDLEAAFRKAVKERDEAWSTGFTDYYTGQGFGKANGLQGTDGTLQVLRQRQKLEQAILNHLQIQKVLLNNTQFNQTTWTQQLRNALSPYIS